MKTIFPLGLFACASGFALPATAQMATVDTPGATAAGVVFVQPRDWDRTATGPETVFAAPERTLRMAVVDVGAAASAGEAAKKAWAIFEPSSAYRARVTANAAPGEGWDERVKIVYETSPSEQREVTALALRRGTGWTVALTDGSTAIANKRSAATGLLEQSLRPAGYQRESFVGRTAHHLTTERLQQLRDFVAQSMQTLQVPGVGLALIDGGKVVWEGGLGVRSLVSPLPVTAHTKFMIASNTKGMSTLLLSILADEGKLRWDQKVIDLYPSFRLGSDEVTRSVEVRHLVCACTGLPRKDFAFILADEGAPATDTFKQLAATQPTSGFGELFQYNNLMASAAGYLGGHLAYPDMELGAAYDRAMSTRILGPLGMRDTTFDTKAGESGNWAQPHGFSVDGQMTLMSNRFNHLIIPHRPAGGAWSSAADVARYVQVELSKGIAPNGKRLVSKANLLERRRRGVPIGENAWYGMGLMEKVEGGVSVITHGGTLQGYHSNFFALPGAGIGAVLLTNGDSGAFLLDPFMRRLLEVVYDGKPEAVAEVVAAAAQMKASNTTRRAKLTIPGEPAVLANLAGAYRSKEGLNVVFSEKDGRKYVRAGFVEGPVATRRNPDGSVSIVSAGPGFIGLDALIGSTGGKRTLSVRDGQNEYLYTELQ
jgi:CubicO group peptidase (beta-lactamase class C family)